MKYEKMNNLFLRQSYLDSWEDYERSLKKKSFIKWDYIILTASNEAQAMAYRNQIENRLEKGLLPEETTYAVLPDPEGKRVGSGGATFQVMRYIADQEPERENPFKNRRILVIHSGVTVRECRSILQSASFSHRFQENCRMEEVPLYLMSLL